MATYAVGDIQGCHEAFRRLLDTVRFDPAQDHLWLVGDLVNRGPDSLAVLRLVRGLGAAAVTVLGNHDLHLLAVAEGFGKLHRKDTIAQVLEAPDRDELLAWLRTRPLLHREGEFLLVHAGLLPQWSAAQAAALANEVQAALCGPGYRDLLEHMYGNRPDRWDDALAGWDRLRVVINAMTRMRLCSPEGAIDFGHKGELHARPAGLVPWFEAPGRAWQGATVVCGHWSALGLELRDGLMALDSGCLWGGHLTAVRVEDRQVYQVNCAGLAGTGRWQ